MGVAEQAYRKRDAKASMARQGGLRPNMRHVQRGIRTFPFVLDVAGKNPIQSPDSPPIRHSGRMGRTLFLQRWSPERHQ